MSKIIYNSCLEKSWKLNYLQFKNTLNNIEYNISISEFKIIYKCILYKIILVNLLR